MLDPVARTLTTCAGSAQNSFSFQDSDPFLGRTEFPLMSHAEDSGQEDSGLEGVKKLAKCIRTVIVTYAMTL